MSPQRPFQKLEEESRLVVFRGHCAENKALMTSNQGLSSLQRTGNKSQERHPLHHMDLSTLIKISPFLRPSKFLLKEPSLEKKASTLLSDSGTGCLQPSAVRGRSPHSMGCLMSNSAANGTSWSGPAGVHAPSYRETDGGEEPGMASSADGVPGRWLVNNIAAPSNFLSAVNVSGSWTCGFLKIAVGLT